ncbi:GreA/GreB family elongation factor [Paraburkholderia terrae]|uniref:GreA/GreB family elongation factor n=1 Tax=Paraburkholderia terrae TaxID=311230 RepID=UPI0030E31698
MSPVKAGNTMDVKAHAAHVPILSQVDMERLSAQLSTASPQQRALVEALEATAVLVDPTGIPPDVVTMNTTVECTTVGGADVYRWTLVYPEEADYQFGRLSVLSPAGFALLGARSGQTVVCHPPSGIPVHFVIRRILSQPESRRLRD